MNSIILKQIERSPKEEVQLFSVRYTFYMRMQSKLVEMEYGVKIDLKGKKEDIEKNEGNDNR